MKVDLREITVLVTRPVAVFGSLRSRPDDLAAVLANCGANVLWHPVIELLPSPDPAALRAALENSGEYGAAVFFSQAGVRSFHDCAQQSGLSLSRQRFARIAAIGSRTAKALDEIGWPADLIPANANSHSMAETLIRNTNGPVLLLRADRGSDVVDRELRKVNRVVDKVAVYESRDITRAQPQVLQRMADGDIDWVTITSESIARSTIRLFGEMLKRTMRASLSPSISAVLSAAGFPHSAEAMTPSLESLVEAIGKKVA